jgi:hypothetical protein
MASQSQRARNARVGAVGRDHHPGTEDVTATGHADLDSTHPSAVNGRGLHQDALVHARPGCARSGEDRVIEPVPRDHAALLPVAIPALTTSARATRDDHPVHRKRSLDDAAKAQSRQDRQGAGIH